MKVPTWTPEMFPGLVGALTTAATAESEAHPAAVASHFLVMFGNAVGRGPHFYVAETRHGMQEFCLVVGPTATGRKGDARHLAQAIIAGADPTWAETCIRSGLSSGEGVIYHVRDAESGIDPKTGKETVRDVGIADKRLLVVETEFSQPLKMFRREGNVLSDVLRDAWDGKAVLGTLVKNNPTQATEEHVSVIGHTTREDLRSYLTDLDIANGLANRFVFVAVERPKLVPSPPRIAETVRTTLAHRTKAALDHARGVGFLPRTAGAERLWCQLYPKLSAERPGLQGALLARGPAHVMRLGALFALLEKATAVDVPNLTAAMAWWDYVVDSVGIVFADRTGNSVADRIKAEMLPGTTLSLTEMREQIFANHVAAGPLRDGLELLRQLGLLELGTERTNGRDRILVTRLREAASGGATS
jgi:hypothetical protein